MGPDSVLRRCFVPMTARIPGRLADLSREKSATVGRVAAERETPDGVPVVIELGRRRVFASALDWPGWSRSGRDEPAALAALAAAEPRYQQVSALAGLDLPAALVDRLRVVERLPGDATTDFGAPGKAAEAEALPLAPAEALRRADLVAAVWTVFDQAVGKAPAKLRNGPRGGGRDRDAIVAHVHEAEWSYARKLGLRLPAPATPPAVVAQHQAILDVLSQPSGGTPTTGKTWSPRYAARRIAWHVLDHAWEIEDRTD